jgi:protein-S-isoprenylcysteine O-methyltransferase
MISIDDLISISNTEWVLVFLFWIIAAFTSKRTVRRERDFTRLFYMLVLVTSFTIAFSNYRIFNFLDRPFLFQQVWWKIPGFFIINIGLLFAIWARITLGTNWSGTITVKEDHELITTGPYRITRNPIYTGIIVALVGNAFLYGAMKSYLAPVILFFAFLYKISREEKFMIETFGDQYRNYMQRVKRIIPLIY